MGLNTTMAFKCLGNVQDHAHFVLAVTSDHKGSKTYVHFLQIRFDVLSTSIFTPDDFFKITFS